MPSKLTLVFFLLCFFQTLSAESLDYGLTAKKVASDTYVFIGKKEDFSHGNGGNIVNTGFIVTEQGVVVIDTGPSYYYGQQMREAIAEITDKPILKAFITHHHPDHFLGNQAFKDVPIYALSGTIDLIKRDADGFLDNMYRMTGKWMKGTELYVENLKPMTSMQEQISDHSFKYIHLDGHTAADLMILDETTGVLFTGDLVFHNRTLTTAHAEPKAWLASLDKIEEINFKFIVPGHGEIAEDTLPVEQTRDYLAWLESTIEDAVSQGLDMNEVMATPIPERFRNFGVLKHEFERSISHRYRIYEQLIFNATN